MNYNLSEETGQEQKKSTYAALVGLISFMKGERGNLILALVAILVNSTLSLAAPILVGHTIDKYIVSKQYHGVLVFSGILFSMFLVSLLTSYLQTKLMGGVGQRMLFSLRNTIFNKLQELPVAFFNQNKAGDLISRVNNDTDKLNQFFSQSLMQFVGSIFIMTGAGIFLLSINLPLGAAALSPALFLWIFTRLISPWVKRKNAVSLRSVGNLSAEIQESLHNFKVIIAFNRRDYFRKKFDEANRNNYSSAIGAGLANNIFMPIYGFSSNIGQMIVLAFGIYLIIAGQFSIGLLISFLAYVTHFYNPLRQLAALWANFQVAMAGWDRISRILSLQPDMETVDVQASGSSHALLEFRNVHFSYPEGREVLHNISFTLDRGKTYAFVGPTGGGKTTTAFLMARLYDPAKGTVFFCGKDIRSCQAQERAGKIGFILQEPFLFSGTVRDNILYGNEEFLNFRHAPLVRVFVDSGLEGLLTRFDNGLETQVIMGGDSISLGQKQLIAFMRAVLRKPELLILDEATANIDTITEQLLEEILKKLPSSTTLVVIAHRLNTIENADEIFFVNSGQVTRAGSLENAMHMLLHHKRDS